MIRTINDKSVEQALYCGFKIAVIDDIPELNKLIDNERILDYRELSPSKELQEKYPVIDEDTFKAQYADEYLEELVNKPHIGALNELYVRSSRNEKIALCAKGDDVNTSHRAVILGLLQAVGAKCIGDNYSPYWLTYRILEVKKNECRNNI